MRCSLAVRHAELLRDAISGPQADGGGAQTGPAHGCGELAPRQTIPDASIGLLGTTEPPAGSTVIPSLDGRADPATVKVTRRGDCPKSPSEIACPFTTPHSWYVSLDDSVRSLD